MEIELFKSGFAAKEWPVGGPNKKEVNEDGSSKHRIYVAGPEGEYGYYDMATKKFKSFPKLKIDFGLVNEDGAVLSITTNSGEIINLGHLNDYEDEEDSEIISPLDSLKKSIKRLEDVSNDSCKIEINLGPSKEIKINGRNNWIKANVSVSIENPENIEELYNCVSEMANSMLILEEDKLRENSKY